MFISKKNTLYTFIQYRLYYSAGGGSTPFSLRPCQLYLSRGDDKSGLQHLYGNTMTKKEKPNHRMEKQS
jgi:hypothetical protein